MTEHETQSAIIDPINLRGGVAIREELDRIDGVCAYRNPDTMEAK